MDGIDRWPGEKKDSAIYHSSIGGRNGRTVSGGFAGVFQRALMIGGSSLSNHPKKGVLLLNLLEAFSFRPSTACP